MTFKIHTQTDEPATIKIRLTSNVIKTIRTPTVFCLLTLVIAGWVSAWLYLDQPPTHRTPNTVIRPLYQALLAVQGEDLVTRNPDLDNYHFDDKSVICSFKTKDFPHYFGIIVRKNDKWFVENTSDEVIAAGFIVDKYISREFGLLAAACRSDHHSRTVLPIAELPLLSYEDCKDGFNMGEMCGNGMIWGGQEVSSDLTLNYAALIHDTSLLLTLIAYLISLTAIHHWPIWKRLTKAQRRRAKHQCPTCAYDLAGLTTPTCPECGIAIDSDPHNVPY